MVRSDIINSLIVKFSYKSYLEIGVKVPANNFDKIIIEEKHGVDPNWKGETEFGNKHIMTSDEYFKNLDKNKRFDLIFIDGLHCHKQIDRDIINSFKHLNPNGTIVLHDCNPIKEYMQKVPRVSSQWTGDGWKSLLKLRMNKNLDVFVVDVDFGCGVVRIGLQKPVKDVDVNWAYFNKHRKRLLNLISIEEFNKWLKN